MTRRIHTKKVLVASIGVAAISYAVACSDGGSGTLAGDGGADAKTDVPTSGNLMPPPEDAATRLDGNTDATDAAFEDVSTSGNLVPPPDDASSD